MDWPPVEKVLERQSSCPLEGLWRSAGGGLGLLQDGFTPQVVGQSAARAPDCELPVDPGLDHLLLPGDGDVPWGELVEKLLVLVFQVHAFDCGEGPDVVEVLGINCLGIRYERRRKDPCADTMKKVAAEKISVLIPFFFFLDFFFYNLRTKITGKLRGYVSVSDWPAFSFLQLISLKKGCALSSSHDPFLKPSLLSTSLHSRPSQMDRAFSLNFSG